MARYTIMALSFIRHLEKAISNIFRGPFPPECLAVVGTHNVPLPDSSPSQKRFSLKDLIGDGILWGVPKHRRTVERRLQRKFGYPEYIWKPLKLKTWLRSCDTCGHDHEVGILCPHCYAKVRDETKLMQEQIQKELGLNPVDKEVVVLYENEKNDQPAEFYNGKRIVEMEKPRPAWFSKNLMQKSTQQPATTNEVKPVELG